jgi:oligopeptide/dipeptide ABC transporter ATP-binding protein
VTGVLVVEGLKQSFRTRKGVLQAVRGISFVVEAGETFAVVGESGSGKSTTARAVMRLLEPTAGRVLLEGEDMLSASRGELRRLRSRMQMVFQDPYSSLDPRMTAVQAVVEPLAVHRSVERSERRERALELLELVGIEGDRARALPSGLSGGQRQRVAIARALILNPVLLVCDEAVSALDVSVQAQVLNLFADLQQRLEVAYLFITHDLAVVSEIADRVAVMYLGRIVEVGRRDQVLGSPQHPYTVALLSAAPHLANQRARIILSGEPSSALSPPPGCSFAPRCPRADAVCLSFDPGLLPVTAAEGHQVACHKPEGR